MPYTILRKHNVSCLDIPHTKAAQGIATASVSMRRGREANNYTYGTQCRKSVCVVSHAKDIDFMPVR